MDLHYRIMGLVAVASERMARQRVNAIPFNWWLMLFFGMLTFFAGVMLRESLINRGAVRDVTVAQVVADASLMDTYVRVIEPQLALDQSLSQGKAGEADDKGEPFWVPMLDRMGKHAMYAQLTYELGKDEMRGGIRGMVRSLKRELKDHVAAQGIKVEGVRPDTRVMLVAGERPARLWLWATLTSLGAAVVLLMLLAFALRYVVFRRHGRVPELLVGATLPPVDPAAVDLRVSGKFRLHEKLRQRFLDTPAVVAEMESEDRGLLASVNASVTMYGEVTDNRAGVWGILIKSGTLAPPQYGSLYAGWRPRPAMRLRFTDAATNGRASAVLSFATPEGREAVRAALYAPPGEVVMGDDQEDRGATENTEAKGTEA